MKKKGNRFIPDFSKKKPAPTHGPDARSTKPPPQQPARNIKPQSTSAKSGRRGQ